MQMRRRKKRRRVCGRAAEKSGTLPFPVLLGVGAERPAQEKKHMYKAFSVPCSAAWPAFRHRTGLFGKPAGCTEKGSAAGESLRLI